MQGKLRNLWLRYLYFVMPIAFLCFLLNPKYMFFMLLPQVVISAGVSFLLFKGICYNVKNGGGILTSFAYSVAVTGVTLFVATFLGIASEKTLQLLFPSKFGGEAVLGMLGIALVSMYFALYYTALMFIFSFFVRKRCL